MFRPIKNDRGNSEPWEYQPAGEIIPKIGMALNFASGKLAICGPTDRPGYVAMSEKETPCIDGEIIPVLRVEDDMIFETTSMAAFDAVKLGDKVTIHTDGLRVTATTGTGAAEVVGIDGTEIGDKIRVRF